ncbi:thiamine phosphate synthase [Methylobacterium komagatae]|uniref:Thiamine phosphate synthase n=1 Tax=Methylobacterium komagatae TaxID=374425 RepID=A0ABW2BQ06_9HYPH
MSLPSPLMAVTDRHGHARPLRETVRAVLAGGGRWIWFRDRDLPDAERRVLGQIVVDEVRAASGFLTVGGDVDLALALGADGIHLPMSALNGVRERVGSDKLIGASAHSLGDVAAAVSAGADYVTLSPIFPTASKPGYGPALGPEAIAAARNHGLPIVALGGMSGDTLASCHSAGAAGFAVMGELMRVSDPAETAGLLLRGWSEPRSAS